MIFLHKGKIMKYISDLHIHSHYSMATSSRLVPEHLEYWARLKGINIIGTGDCIHPGWFEELRGKLEPCENGLYRLKREYRLDESVRMKHPSIPGEVYFILTGELSSIYKRDGKVRKVHNICVFPDFDSCRKVQSRLDEAGNIRSDGRPILGIDSRVILDMVLESAQESFLIPAHIWTPWFSVLGSKSGFDTIGECYGDLTRHIFAVETGLSSDPPMNRTCSFLDNFRLVSNSDAHSPEKIGREANLFDAELSYSGMYRALKDDSGFTGTIEFFPEEGKYHLDGHKKCGIVWDPLETAKHGGICPVCGKPVTKGVMYRVAELGDRNLPRTDLAESRFYSITQLPDLLAEVMGQGSSSSKKVMNEYMRLIRALGSEFHIYLEAEPDEVAEAGGPLLAEGIRRLRSGHVHLRGGYDGEFGEVKVFAPGELAAGSLFSGTECSIQEQGPVKPSFDIDEFKRYAASPAAEGLNGDVAGFSGLTPEQAEGVRYTEGPCLVIAGPGSGKTRMLTERIKFLTGEGIAAPGELTALTFSNRAAGEIRSRLDADLVKGGLHVSTFHAFGLKFIRENIERLYIDGDFRILSDDERLQAVASITSDRKEAPSALAMISSVKQGIECRADGALLSGYVERLTELNAIDIDDLIDIPCTLLASDRALRHEYNRRMPYLLVDEFQDINAAQYSLIRMLVSEDGKGLFVIGDPDQAIYGFRGSDVRYIEELQRDYESLKTVRLTRSFRCPGKLLMAAGQVLGKKDYLEGMDEGVKVRISRCESARSEADLIASTIERLMGGVRSFSMDSGIADGSVSDLGLSDFAILCRSSFMFGPLIEALSNHGIPCQAVDTEPFYSAEPYRQVMQMIRRVCSPAAQDLTAEERTAAELLRDGRTMGDIMDILLSARGQDFDRERVHRMFDSVYDAGEFMRTSLLNKGTDDYIPSMEAVSLITIHASKGLEFNTVFIPGCEEGILPFSLFGQTDYAEEERVFYVAMTRASGALYLSHAEKRLYRGRILENNRSRFLDRIERRLTEQEKRAAKQKKKDDNQLNLF